MCGPYQVWLAEWTGTQVAVKELVSFQDKAKDEVNKRKARDARRIAQQRKLRELSEEEALEEADREPSDTDRWGTQLCQGSDGECWCDGLSDGAPCCIALARPTAPSGLFH